jgi:hypothetical protein
MHSKEDEEPRLAPENDEKQWEKVPPPSRYQAGYEDGWQKGWAAAIVQLRDVGHADAARDLEKLSA